MNASAVALFVASPQVRWPQACATGAGAMFGGLAGAWARHRVNERILRLLVVAPGVALTGGLFARPV